MRGRLALVLALGMLLGRPAAACTGDCNGDRAVTIDELVLGVNIALGGAARDQCDGLDTNGDGNLTIDELVAAVANAMQGCAPQTRAFVVTSNFQAGSFATVSLDEPRVVSRSTAQRRLHNDAVARTRDGLVYVINRRFGDNIQLLDPADNFRTRYQCSTGNGTNPQDIAFAGDTKAYVSLYEEPELLIVNPAPQPDCSDFLRGSIDLGSLADADGIPDMNQMAVVGNRLYVALARLDINTALRLPAGNAALAVIDIASDTLVGSIELSGENPFAATKGLLVRGGKIYVSQAGLFGVMDGGIERVDLASGSAEGFFVTEDDLGGDITDFVVVSNRLGYAVIARPDFATALISFDPVTAAVTGTHFEASGYTLFDLELNDRGELFLADRRQQQDGIRIFRAADGTQLTARPLDLGLSPFEIVFVP